MRTTSNNIEALKPNEIFVFGSNSEGQHVGGAARLALNKFGAINGQGEGLQGQTYAIPTMYSSSYHIAKHVDIFIHIAKKNPDKTFLVTEIGCGIAGFKPDAIAPLFRRATDIENIHLPESFWAILKKF